MIFGCALSVLSIRVFTFSTKLDLELALELVLSSCFTLYSTATIHMVGINSKSENWSEKISKFVQKKFFCKLTCEKEIGQPSDIFYVRINTRVPYYGVFN